MLKQLHHLTFVVADLEKAMAQYRELLGAPDFIREELSARGVITARFQLAETWIVLVQPTDMSGAPGRFLTEHGEGLFILSFAVANLEDAARELKQRGVMAADAVPRKGLANWHVMDLYAEKTCNVLTQITQERA